MISLLIDTSSVNLIVSIIKDNEILSFTKKSDIKSISTRLLDEIASSIEKCNLEIKDINAIFVTSGPGSFTGLRVGITAAKTMAYALKKKVIPISSLALLASTNFDTDYIIPYIDARRDYVYAAIYDQNLNPVMEDTYIKIEDLLLKTKGKKITFTGYSKVNQIEDYIVPEENIIKIVTKYKDRPGVNPHQLNPNYLKRTEAEENKCDKKLSEGR